MRSSETISRRPIVGFSEAPTTAIDFGRNSASSRIADLPRPLGTRSFTMSRAKRRSNPIVASHRFGLEEQARHALRLEFVGVRSLAIEIALVAIAVHLQDAEVRGP